RRSCEVKQGGLRFHSSSSAMTDFREKTIAVPQLNRSAWWTFAAGVIGLHFGATQVAVVILIRFQHDLVRDAMSASICDRFLLRHDPVVVCIALLEICHPAGITAGPFHDGHAAVVIRIA